MLIYRTGEIIFDDSFLKCEFQDEVHYVKGLVYISGFRAGKESVKQIYELTQREGQIPFERLRGAFTYCIKRNSGTVFFFTSNSEMHTIFVSDHAVSSSFLEHLSYLKGHNVAMSFSNEAICEYYTLGKIFFKKTFLNEIAMLPNDKYIIVEHGCITIHNKNISAIDGASSIDDPHKFFKDFAYAIQNMKVVSALTGGYDSRMVVTMVSPMVPLQLFLSTNDPDDTESRVSKTVAAELGLPLEIYHTDKPKLSEQLIWKEIQNGDGIYPLSLESNLRIDNFKENLCNRGFELSLTGDGGVLHKDWEWMQDLPFYHKKKTDLKRFYHQRIVTLGGKNCLGDRLSSTFEKQEDRFIEELSVYKKDINTRSYDSLYHYVSGSQCLGYNMDRGNMVSYAPLWELDFVRYSYHLPRRKRFFYNFIREIVTSVNPNVARIPTNYGTTSSSEAKYIFRDVFYQFKDYARKAIVLFGRTFFKKSLIKGAPVDWSLENDLRLLSVAEKSVSWGISNHYIDAAATIQNIPYRQLTRLIHTYLLADRYGIVPGAYAGQSAEK